jgi:hypothetical protein
MMQTILKPEAMMIVRSQNRTKPVPKGNGDCLSQEFAARHSQRQSLRTARPQDWHEQKLQGRIHVDWDQPIDMDASLFDLRGEQQSAIRCAEDSVNSSNKAPPIPERDWRRSVY